MTSERTPATRPPRRAPSVVAEVMSSWRIDLVHKVRTTIRRLKVRFARERKVWEVGRISQVIEVRVPDWKSYPVRMTGRLTQT